MLSLDALFTICLGLGRCLSYFDAYEKHKIIENNWIDGKATVEEYRMHNSG